MTLYKDKYRVESARLKGWDYSAVGYYFVTICTRDRLCTLGNVVDGVMRLSPVGEIVAEEWQKTAQIRKNVTLDEWVVMPNHLHGIVIINDEAVLQETPQPETPQPETPQRGVSTEETDQCRDVPVARLPVNVTFLDSDDFKAVDVTTGRLSKGSLGAIIGQFKSVCTKRIWAAGHDFAWQSRFHDESIPWFSNVVDVLLHPGHEPLKGSVCVAVR